MVGCQFVKGDDESLVISGERHGQRIRKQGYGGLSRGGLGIKHNPMRIFFFVIKNSGRYSVQPFLCKTSPLMGCPLRFQLFSIFQAVKQILCHAELKEHQYKPGYFCFIFCFRDGAKIACSFAFAMQ